MNEFIVIHRDKIPSNVQVSVLVTKDFIEVFWGPDADSKRVSSTKELDDVLGALRLLYDEEEKTTALDLTYRFDGDKYPYKEPRSFS